ncbi:MAG TPA: MazG family protein [Jatrophihabitantaceae bacterium]
MVDADPTSPLQRAAAVMDRLRSPGGCPWDAAQTHQSLAKYLIEETYETLEAIETGDMALLREELGDLLLQVLFHARLAEELPAGQRFSIDDVAGDLVDKLVHRHPHVFADVAVTGADEVNENWERLKATEKGRASITEGVPMGQPALALAAKLVSRADRAGVDAPIEGDGVGERLLAVVRDAVAAGVDPELALRETARAYRDGLVEAETR